MCIFSSLTVEKARPLLWKIIEKILDPKKKSSSDGALLELKKGSSPIRT